MGHRAMFAVFVLLLGSAAARAELVVSTQGGLVEVTARGAPLNDVLRAFAAETGATVSFEGLVPRQPVTVNVKGLTPVEAVAEILDGLGISYVLRSDTSGTGVEAIHIIDGATGHELARPANQSLSPARGPGPDTEPDPGLEDPVYGDEPVDEEEEQPAPRARRQPGVAAAGRPAGPGATGAVEPWEDAPGLPDGVEPPGLESAPVTDSGPPPDPPLPSTPTTQPPGMNSPRPEDGAAEIEAPLPAPPGSRAGTGKPTVVPPGMKLEGSVPPVPPPSSPE